MPPWGVLVTAGAKGNHEKKKKQKKTKIRSSALMGKIGSLKGRRTVGAYAWL